MSQNFAVGIGESEAGKKQKAPLFKQGSTSIYERHHSIPVKYLYCNVYVYTIHELYTYSTVQSRGKTTKKEFLIRPDEISVADAMATTMTIIYGL
jgi:hypothetical protein